MAISGIEKIRSSSLRQRFVSVFFEGLHSIPYVLLKHTGEPLKELPDSADLDILLPKSHLNRVVDQLLDAEGISKCRVEKRWGLTQVFLFFRDLSFLQIDFLHDFVRKSLRYLDPQELLQKRKLNEEGIYVPDAVHFLEHVLLFQMLNGSGVPRKYLCYLLPEEGGLLKIINRKYGTVIRRLEDLESYRPELARSLRTTLKSFSFNRGFRQIAAQIRYTFQTLRSANSNRGLIISFSGVDGAGKSTILADAQQLLKRKYRRDVVVLRHRPSLLPILSAYRHGKRKAEQKAAERLPRQGQNDRFLPSLLRFAYYFVDYLFGQHYVRVCHLWRGRVVLYDRYYYDFVVDGKRSNITLPAAVPRWLFRFVSKPALNFFLYARPEIILSRKQELEPAAITQLSAGYLALFQRLSREYPRYQFIPIENIDRADTLRLIEEKYLERL